MSRRVKLFDPHALDRLRERCWMDLDYPKAQALLQTAVPILRAANGEWLFVEMEGAYAVLVRQSGVVRTALTLEHAFANCPQGMFYFLVSTGHLIAALNLRLFYVTGVLPEAHGSDDGNYKYSKRKARILWEAFHWQQK